MHEGYDIKSGRAGPDEVLRSEQGLWHLSRVRFDSPQLSHVLNVLRRWSNDDHVLHDGMPTLQEPQLLPGIARKIKQ